MEQSDIRKHYAEHGWVLIKNVFPKDEIEHLRERVIASLKPTTKTGNPGDILSNPLLQYVLLDDRLTNIYRQLLPGQPVYFGDGNFLFDNKEFGAFHKDNADRNDPDAPDWDGEYDIFRLGIYLQDHIKDSGGLLLRDKSFKRASITEGRPFNVPIEMGDVVVWNLRTTHSGNARLFKLFPGLIIDSKYYRILPKFLFRKEKKKRGAIFITIGNEGKHLTRYIKYLKSRQYPVLMWQNSVYDPQVVEEVERHGLKVIDIRPEVMDINTETLNENYKPIPY